jgi:hypothetical protein
MNKIEWRVFPNSDEDAGGWCSIVESTNFYLGGEWHKTEKEAEKYAKNLAAKCEKDGSAAKMDEQEIPNEVFKFLEN